MQITEVRRKAFAMPLNDPAYPPGPYKFYNREFVVITYRTDPDQLREVTGIGAMRAKRIHESAHIGVVSIEAAGTVDDGVHGTDPAR